ncbi:MAG TPA: heavy metal-associated domain-containing protein [Flavitalea sp.]|nr:heavy metal-associated domain-containing protein [Flavitalea sp.]
MKKLFFSLISILLISVTQAQFRSASLTASGLTCAMCTKAINNSLDRLSFIESVSPDIKNSAFNIVFRKDAAVDPDLLRKAVEDAGFSVSTLKLKAQFNNVLLKKDSHITLGGKNYHFVNVTPQTLNGEKVITMIDKNFLSAKQFKKFAATTSLSCIQTGKVASCCPVPGGISSRLYHVTI